MLGWRELWNYLSIYGRNKVRWASGKPIYFTRRAHVRMLITSFFPRVLENMGIEYLQTKYRYYP